MDSKIPEKQAGAVINNPGADASIGLRDDLPVEDVGPNQILVKLEYSGICGSEIRALFAYAAYNPIVGHEGVGTVVKTGEHVAASTLGQRVGVKWLYSACGGCSCCRRGFPNNCPHQVNTSRHVPGTLQQYVVADARYVTTIPDGLTSEIASPLLCAGLTMAGAVSKLEGSLTKGDWVVISGSGGGLGHLGVQIAARLNGFRVIAVDAGQPKRELSLKSGAERFIDFKEEDVEARVKALTGEGAHAVLAVSGSQEAFRMAPKLARNMGTIISIGLPRNDFEIPLSASLCSARALTVTGVATGTEEQIEELLHNAATGKIAPEIQVLGFDKLPEIFSRLKADGIVGRIVVRIPQ